MYELPALPYELNALEPHIDATTMEIHHGKHHGTYVSKLNGAIPGSNLTDLSLSDLMGKITDSTSPAIRNNGGGHYNHSLFWTSLAPKSGGGGGEPTGELQKKIVEAFGSFAAFQEKFAEAAATRFGSGWAWLSKDANGSLTIGSTPNQDNPLMPASPYRGTPLLGLDVWEHAYYLNYQNRRPDYVKAFWNIVNWEAVAKRLV